MCSRCIIQNIWTVVAIQHHKLAVQHFGDCLKLKCQNKMRNKAPYLGQQILAQAVATRLGILPSSLLSVAIATFF